MYIFDVVQKDGANENGPSQISLCTLATLDNAELRIERGMGKADKDTLKSMTSIEVKINGVKTDSYSFFDEEAENSSEPGRKAARIHDFYTQLCEAAQKGEAVFNLAEAREKAGKEND